jgi:hypothetical protein
MRKRKKAGRYPNCSGNTAKKVAGSQLEWWISKVGGACQCFTNLYHVYHGIEIVKSLIEQYMLSS